MWRRIAPVVALLALAVGLLPSSSAVADTRAQPQLSIRTDHTHYNYGSTIRLSVHLGSSGDNRRVSIVEQVAGRSRVIDANDTVGAHGDLDGTIAAQHNATYSVRFAGSSTYAGRTVSARRITVAVALASSLSGRYATQGRNALVHTGHRARYDVGVGPSKARRSVYLRLQSWHDHRWITVSLRRVTLSGSSVGGMSFTARKGSYRVRGEYRGDSTNTARNVHWSYLRFT